MSSRPDGASAVAAVAAVVVNYNAQGCLGACLDSIADGGVTNIVVVDNGSVDGSRTVAQKAGVEWVEAGGNLGYGRAANRGATWDGSAASPYLLVSNPDLVVGKGAVAALVQALDADPLVGAVGPRIVNPDGSLYPSARSFPRMLDAIGHGLLGQVVPGNRFSRRYRMLDWDHRNAADVDWVSGACFLVRREAWDDVGGFDGSYFMYMEDVDLCWRLGRAGWRVRYEPAAEVLHVQGVSADLHPYRMLAAHHVSMWRFAWRTTTGVRRVALPLVATGLMARFVLTAAHRRAQGTIPGKASGPLP
ncbi:MAG TPA: glycosyltransferase family 2 protein [Acidimicrobiales bacterium]|nr:glycosyltransferase family 2 protein [Acidimicrobiales bacterium]